MVGIIAFRLFVVSINEVFLVGSSRSFSIAFRAGREALSILRIIKVLFSATCNLTLFFNIFYIIDRCYPKFKTL